MTEAPRPVRRSVRDTPPPSYTPARVQPRPAGTDPIVVGSQPAPAARPTPAAHPPAASSPAARSAGQPRAAAVPPARPPGPAHPPPGSAPVGRPGGPTAPPGPPAPPARPGGRRRRRGRVVALVLALLLAWPVGLGLWANARVDRVPALSGAPATAGATYLIAGSDARDGAIDDDTVAGARTDTIMLLQVPDSGPAALLSLPRDTYVEIPGHGRNKLNAAFALGGPPLLVTTVEGLTGLTVDHYVEIGFGGVVGVVDAVGGVELCLDRDVNEPLSGLVWTAGCHRADGTTALAFSRERYQDPNGDIGRTERQRQVVGAVVDAVASPVTLLRPDRQVRVLRAGTDAVAVSEGTGAFAMARLALGFRAATGENGITGTPPIVSLNHQPGGVGSTVLLDEAALPDFFAQIRDGSLPPGPVGGWGS